MSQRNEPYIETYSESITDSLEPQISRYLTLLNSSKKGGTKAVKSPEKHDIEEMMILITQCYSTAYLGAPKYWRSFKGSITILNFSGLSKIVSASNLEKMIKDIKNLFSQKFEKETLDHFTELSQRIDNHISNESTIYSLINSWFRFSLLVSRVRALEMMKILFFDLLNKKRKFGRLRDSINKLKKDMNALPKESKVDNR